MSSHDLISPSFFTLDNISCVNVPQTLYPFPSGMTARLIPALAIMNKAVVNTRVQVLV